MAVFVFRQSHMIVPHCFWQCLLLQSTTEIANIPGFRDMAGNAHILVRHGNTFLKTSKLVFQFRQSHLIVPHCRWQCLVLLQSKTEIANIPGVRDMADTPTSLFDMVRDFCKFPKAFFQLKQLHLIVPHCFWQCQHLQSTTEIANIRGFCNTVDNTLFLVQRGRRFLQTFKGCFRVQTMIVPHCCWQCLLLQSTTEIANIPGVRDIT